VIVSLNLPKGAGARRAERLGAQNEFFENIGKGREKKSQSAVWHLYKGVRQPQIQAYMRKS